MTLGSLLEVGATITLNILPALMHAAQRPDGSGAHLPGEARAVEIVHIVPGQVRELEASRIEDQGGQIDYAAARQGGAGDTLSSGLLRGGGCLPSLGGHGGSVHRQTSEP